MSGEDKAEARLRELLRDPRWSLPAGPDPERRVRRAAGRQRRRLAGLAGVAAAAAIAVAIPAGIGVVGHLPRPQQPPAAPTLYVGAYKLGPHGGTVVPINTATNTPGTPIQVVSGPNSPTIADNVGKIAITPDGKTAYVASGPGTVTPINTATNTPGKKIPVGRGPVWIAITPDGKTAYVASQSGTCLLYTSPSPRDRG